MKNRTLKKINKTLSLIILILMIATLTATSMFVSYAVTVDTVFTDVSKTDWFYGDVQYAYDNSIMNGVDTDEFAPSSPLSRAMGVTILYRAAGEPGAGGATQIPFDDVESGQWYTDAVLWAYDSNIVNGRAVNEFATTANITRAELATILLRYADHEELELPETKDGSFADEDEIPDYAKEAVNALYKAGIVNGKEGNNFDPSANVTRAETAAMIHRFIETAAKPTDTPDDPQEPDEPSDTPDDPQNPPKDEPQNPGEDDPKEERINVVFIGNSFTITGHTKSYMQYISGGRVKVIDLSDYGFSLNKHVSVFQSNPDAVLYKKAFEAADIVVFQEFGGDFPDVDSVNQLMDMIGRDKKYYAFMPFSGPHKNYSPFPDEYYQTKKQEYADMNITLIYLGNIAPYNPEFNQNDFMLSDGHPNDLFGYCIALALYCTFFDVKAVDQNSGNLSSNYIPGETSEEEAAYMAKLKETVQYILDIQ